MNGDFDKNLPPFKVCWVAELTDRVCFVCQLWQAVCWRCLLAARKPSLDPFFLRTVLTCRMVLGHACDMQP
jgi:hypothetical protein